jgi:hypothetical protein
MQLGGQNRRYDAASMQHQRIGEQLRKSRRHHPTPAAFPELTGATLPMKMVASAAMSSRFIASCPFCRRSVWIWI